MSTTFAAGSTVMSLPSPIPSLPSLPTEITLNILEHLLRDPPDPTVSENSQGVLPWKSVPALLALAATNRRFAHLARLVFYRVLRLSTSQRLDAFLSTFRTEAVEAPLTAAVEYVGSLIIDVDPEAILGVPESGKCFPDWDRGQEFAYLLTSSHVKEVIIPAQFIVEAFKFVVPGKHGSATASLPMKGTITHLTLDACTTIPPDCSFPRPLLNSLTHLRVLSPSWHWLRPSIFLSSFLCSTLPESGSAQSKESVSSLRRFTSLTHLCLPRRTQANPQNDIEFVEDVQKCLSELPSLQMLVIEIIQSRWQVNIKISDQVPLHLLTPTNVGFEPVTSVINAKAANGKQQPIGKSFDGGGASSIHNLLHSIALADHRLHLVDVQRPLRSGQKALKAECDDTLERMCASRGCGEQMTMYPYF